MAHVINLGAQALLKSRSKAPHHNPYDTDAHLSKGDAERRDDIGLVREISVKVRAVEFYVADDDSLQFDYTTGALVESAKRSSLLIYRIQCTKALRSRPLQTRQHQQQVPFASIGSSSTCLYAGPPHIPCSIDHSCSKRSDAAHS